MKFLVKYNVLYSDQYGFRKGKSTCDAILKFTNEILSCFNDRKVMLSIFLDFSKAFDTIDQNILFKKIGVLLFQRFYAGIFYFLHF